MNSKHILFAAALFVATTTDSLAAVPVLAPVDFSLCMNASNDIGQPRGTAAGNAGTAFSPLTFTLADPSAGNNLWVGSSGGKIVIKLSVTSPTAVYILMNTLYGQPAIPNATVTFHGTNHAHKTFRLDGNTNIRDYNNWVWTDSINGTSTEEWWTNNSNPQPQDQSHRVDAQHFNLGKAFAGQTLMSITISAPSNAAPNFMEPALFAIGIDAAGRTHVRSRCVLR